MPSNEDAFIDLRRLETQTLKEPKKRSGEYETGSPDLVGPLVQLEQQGPPLLQLDVEIRFSFLRLVDGSLIANTRDVLRATVTL
jgi:hypothetical protein